MQKIAKTRGVKGAASWCALAAILYLLAKALLQAAASLCMGLRVKGASLADPAGFSQFSTMLITLVIGAAAIAVPVVWLLRTTRLEPADLRLNLPGQWSPLFCICVFLGAANLANLIGGLLARLIGHKGTGTVLPAAGAELFLAFCTLCILPAVGEELLFRGALQGLMRPCGSAAAIVAPALLFALLHLDIIQCLTALICGLLLGWLAERTGSILPGMLLHFINNSLAFLDIYLQLYAPRGVAVWVELFILLFFPVAGAWLLFRALHSQSFSLTDGLRPGVAASAVFQSPAYLVGIAFLGAYTLYLSFM